MTENFAERFVHHRRICLAPKAVAKLVLHHRERGIDITRLEIGQAEGVCAADGLLGARS